MARNNNCCCGVCCFKCSSCKRFWCQIFGIIKRAIPVVILQVIGWALFSYVEDDLDIKHCFTNQEYVADKLYPKVDENARAYGLFVNLYFKTNQSLTYNQSAAVYKLFQKFFKVPDSIPRAFLGYIGCMKWYRFSVLTMSTIGFGGVTPKTDTGKLLVIPYALVTIPVMLSFLAFVGSVVSDWTERLMYCVHRKIKGNKPLRYKLIKRCLYLYIIMWIIMLMFVIKFIFNPLFFESSSGKEWLNALYFMFVTFSTIGYGDITGPADSDEFYGLELALGLAVFSGLADSILALKANLKFGFKRSNQFLCVRYIEDEECTESSILPNSVGSSDENKCPDDASKTTKERIVSSELPN